MLSVVHLFSLSVSKVFIFICFHSSLLAHVKEFCVIWHRFFAWSSVNAECSFPTNSEIAIEFAFFLEH